MCACAVTSSLHRRHDLLYGPPIVNNFYDEINPTTELVLFLGRVTILGFIYIYGAPYQREIYYVG